MTQTFHSNNKSFGEWMTSMFRKMMVKQKVTPQLSNKNSTVSIRMFSKNTHQIPINVSNRERQPSIDIVSVLEEHIVKESQSLDFNVYMKCFVHELRTPINTISLGMGLIQQSNNIEDIQNIIHDIKESITYLENILTKFANVNNGIIELNPFEPFSLKKLFFNIEILILYHFKQSNVNFEYHIDPSVYEWNYGDIHNIKHVIINLLKNAITYHKSDRENQVVIHVQFIKDEIVIENDQQKSIIQTISISVIDTNNPLLPHIKKHLFEKYNSTSGSGMGLYICKTIIELHGGNICHEFSEGGIGNKFIFTLPLKTYPYSMSKMNSHCSSPNAISLKTISTRKDKKNIKNNENVHVKTKYNVLIVDDSELNRKLMQKMIQSNSIFNQIHTAENGTQAMSILKKNSDISIIFLDKFMHFMNGYEVAKAIRSSGYNGLIIGVTGDDSQQTILDFQKNGADMVLTKPIDIKHMGMIRQFLERNSTQRPLNKTLHIVRGHMRWVMNDLCSSDVAA